MSRATHQLDLDRHDSPRAGPTTGTPARSVSSSPRPSAALRGESLRLAALITILAAPSLAADDEPAAAMPRGYSIPLVDLAGERHRQVVVDREPGQYLGHPTTVLLEDGRTMIAVYPKGHGRGAIVMKRSDDGGLTWSERLPVPESWAGSREVPTIHRVIDPTGGRRRLILFSGLHPCRLSVSEDDGLTWTGLAPVGDWGGIVTMASVERLHDGRYVALFHDDGRFLRAGGAATDTFRVLQTFSADGGLTWSEPEVVCTSTGVHLCEPGLVRSPDGRRLAALLRENSRTRNAHVIFSDDEAATWTAPRELPGALTGDRHTARYAPDGRLFISFRDTTHESPTQGDWVGWVGTYEDIARGREGQYRVRLMDNHHRWDCAYPGVEVLPDGTFVATTYGHWTEGEPPYVVSVRFTLAELDAKAAAGSAPASAGPADLVIENARIWSDGLVAPLPFAAVTDGRFVAVGDRDERLVGPGTVRLDAVGRTVVPGLIDAHAHLLGGGRQLGRLQLREAADEQDFIARVRRWAEGLPADAWILGGRWSVESWAAPRAPTKRWVDDASGGRPLYLPRMDGHSALVNSTALARAGITADGPPDPVGGTIDRDPDTGEPTGILRESAMDLVARHLPAPGVEEDLAALRRAMAEALGHGVTAVGDIPDVEDLPSYRRLAGSDLPMRLFLYPTAADFAEAAARARAFPARPYWLQINGLKMYLDGSLGSRTAMMRDPYLEPERPGWRGLWREGVDDGRFARNLAAANDAGMQAIVHAIGDEANHRLLDTLAGTFDDLPAARCRSEHAQHLLPDDVARFAALGVIASMQPYHKADDGRYAETFIGAERARTSYAFRSLLDTGAIVAFGSDWPVVTINPWRGIEAAVTGRTLDGRTWQTQETIPVAEALRCYTSRAAYAVRAEDEIGRIAPGYRADFVILAASPFGPDVDWAAIRPAAVYVEGRRVVPPP